MNNLLYWWQQLGQEWQNVFKKAIKLKTGEPSEKELKEILFLKANL